MTSLQNKGFDAGWIQSLFDRGTPDIYCGEDLKYIGMPVGGICAGQLYLGGDGRLWHWDVFNVVYNSYSQDVSWDKERYLHPPLPGTSVEQGFALEVDHAGRKEVLRLDKRDFADIRFRGEYPIGNVAYRKAGLPVSVSLEAFSPFIPLNADDSGLPATFLHYTIHNESPHPVGVSIIGWMENAIGRQLGEAAALRNQVIHEDEFTLVECSMVKAAYSGTMGLALLGSRADVAIEAAGQAELAGLVEVADGAETPLIGLLGRELRLEPGASETVVFAVAWHFPNLKLEGLSDAGRYYANKFGSSREVISYLAAHRERLVAETRLWRDTWYDSTLPYWFLDRTFLNTSILATSTAFRFPNGRFYAWEGVGSCQGTCTHVWHYAQAMARIFPALERSAREMADFNPEVGFREDGSIGFRGEFGVGDVQYWAADGQAGCILRAYREHQMSRDNTFLTKLWPQIKKAIEFLMSRDVDNDGLLDGPQHNTLDADWFGKVVWLSGLYGAALRAGEKMAEEMGEGAFAQRCRSCAETNSTSLPTLFNGDYFMNQVDPAHSDAINSGTGCEIDQVLGQCWAFHVGLDRVFPADQTRKALGALWNHNFVTDAGAYRATHQPGRWYAADGEAGLLICTFPRPDWDYLKASGKGQYWAAGYFNECMNGFEYQVASHMLWEGMLPEGMAITRAVHDRYHPSKRNPWNEFECGDHYARSMASYGVFLAACGYESHGPNGHLGFAPRLHPEDFRAPFTTAEGWGTFSQKAQGEKLTAALDLKWGTLRLRTLALELPWTSTSPLLRVTLNGEELAARASLDGNRVTLSFAQEIDMLQGGSLAVEVG